MVSWSRSHFSASPRSGHSFIKTGKKKGGEEERERKRGQVRGIMKKGNSSLVIKSGVHNGSCWRTLYDGRKMVMVLMPKGSIVADSHHKPRQLGEVLRGEGGEGSHTKVKLVVTCNKRLLWFIPPFQPQQKNRCLASSHSPQTPNGYRGQYISVIRSKLSHIACNLSKD